MDAVPIPDIVQPTSSTAELESAELESAAIPISELESVELNPLNSKLLTGFPRPSACGNS